MRFPFLAATTAGLIGAATIATPAAAIDPQGISTSKHGVRIHHGNRYARDWVGSDRRRHRDDDAFIYEDREYAGDTLFRADGFNDWWHDAPHRNRPAWVMTNQNCDRQYWMGGAWRC
ncbi:hypothetical protein G7076_10450 [Sphingomonas sp. HDW15A]|uniref:hypothetical protein n=1 Tax=Sphingomonas sp. HDW15A TaxID=2714942 RepID=UPI0014075A43|nr:hypothetical protein [Sphingomonas sp. HDW15A]QIK96797.1 hypothetical protein G7076_10450 [Sphingomonas sp. HDW15A]